MSNQVIGSLGTVVKEASTMVTSIFKSGGRLGNTLDNTLAVTELESEKDKYAAYNSIAAMEGFTPEQLLRMQTTVDR